MTRQEMVEVLSQFHREVVIPQMDERESRLETRLETRLAARFEAMLKMELRREIGQLRSELPGLLRNAITPDITGARAAPRR